MIKEILKSETVQNWKTLEMGDGHVSWRQIFNCTSFRKCWKCISFACPNFTIIKIKMNSFREFVFKYFFLKDEIISSCHITLFSTYIGKIVMGAKFKLIEIYPIRKFNY